MLDFLKKLFVIDVGEEAVDSKNVFFVGKQRYTLDENVLTCELHNGPYSYVNIIKVAPLTKEIFLDSYIKTKISKMHTVTTSKFNFRKNPIYLEKKLEFKSTNDGTMEFLHVVGNKQVLPRLFSVDAKEYHPLPRENETLEEKEDIENEKEFLIFKPFIDEDYPIEIFSIYTILGKNNLKVFQNYLNSKRQEVTEKLSGEEGELFSEMLEFIDKFWVAVSKNVDQA